MSGETASFPAMRGFPPPPEERVTSANWIDAPYNRWGFWHVRELAATARISRGGGPAHELPRDGRDLSSFAFEVGGRSLTWPQMIEETYTDALVVLQRGELVFEWYRSDVDPSMRHLLMSCSKSLTATLIGVLVGKGLVDPDRTVPDHIPDLRGTAWEGCTVQHVLDMRTGTRFDESDYDDPNSDGRLIEEVSGYRPRTRDDIPADTYEWIVSLENDRPHGGAFEYRSILTDVLAWIAQSVTGRRFPDLFSDEIWSRIGAECDADIIVDSAGFPVVEGGICTTARDFARFGLMVLQGGEIGGRRIVPSSWIDRVRRTEPELIAAYAEAPEYHAAWPNAFYHDQWWVLDPDEGMFSAYGINGQQLFVHGPSETVIAKFSTWPAAIVDNIASVQDAGLAALARQLGGGRKA